MSKHFVYRPTPGAKEVHTSRRTWLRGAAAIVIAGLTGTRPLAAASTDARKLPAQTGDQLSFPSWENDGRLITLDDLVPDAPPVLAYPRDPTSGVIRERSRLNQILLMRFEQALLDADQQAQSANGVFAYSGLCTHTACAVSEWDSATRHLQCPCHGSEFDPLRRGARISGPATRSLPGLPVHVHDGYIVITGGFTSKVGAQT